MYNEIFALYWILQYLAAPPPMWHKGGEGGGGLGPVNVEKSVTGKRVTLPAESTYMQASVYMRKKLAPLPERRADSSARSCSECLAVTRLGEPKCL